MDRHAFGLRAPKVRIRGVDFAGRVEAVGGAVTAFAPGDEVYGVTTGAFAEYVCARDNTIAHKPAALTFEQAAAVPLAANTALIALRDKARVQPGQHVVINGASGGVGTFAIQLAKARGAEVTAVCSPRNTAQAHTLGADHTIDYTTTDFTRGANCYDTVLDLVGNHSLTALRRTLAPGGTLILSGGGTSRGGSLLGPLPLIVRGQLVARLARRQRIHVLTTSTSTKNLTALTALVEAGALTPVIDRTYALPETPEAMRYLETTHAAGKVIIAT
jgi:NADPH:quinone reductase-like Zn-dependent oxidoreductase